MLCCAVATAMLAVSPDVAADAFDQAVADEVEDQKIHGVLGTRGVKALNQKAAKDLKQLFQSTLELTKFREAPTPKTKNKPELWTTGYYLDGDVEMNLRYFEEYAKKNGEQAAVIELKLTLAHEAQHGKEDKAGTLPASEVDQEKSARKQECLLYKKIRSEIKSKEVQAKFDAYLARFFDEDCKEKKIAAENIQQLSYKKRAQPADTASDRIELTFRSLAVRYDFDADWQLLNDEAQVAGALAVRLVGPSVGEVNAVAGTIYIQVEPDERRGGRFNSPAEMADAAMEATVYERAIESPSTPFEGMDVHRTFILEGAVARFGGSNELEDEAIQVVEGRFARTPITVHRRLAAARRGDFLWLVYVDVDAAVAASSQLAINEFQAVVESMRQVPFVARARTAEISVQRLNVTFPVPIGWDLGPLVADDDGAVSVRAGGPVGPSFTQPSITVIGRLGEGAESDLDQIARGIADDVAGDLQYVRATTLAGQPAREVRTTYALGGAGNAITNPTRTERLVFRSAVAIVGSHPLQINVVDNADESGRAAELFRLVRQGLRVTSPAP